MVILSVTEMWTKGTGHYSKQILVEGNIIIPVLIVWQDIGVSSNKNPVM